MEKAFNHVVIQKLWTKEFIDITIINVLVFFSWQLQLSTLPIYLRDLLKSDAMVGFSTMAAATAALLIRPLAGYANDRFGRKIVMIIGIVFIMLSMLLYNWFSLLSIIFMIRILSGIGWGLSSTSISTVATDTINKGRFGEGIGFFSLSQSVSLALAPAIGIIIMTTISFKWLTFSAAALLSISIAVALFTRCRQTDKNHYKKFIPYEKSAVRPAIITICVGIVIGSVFGFSSLYSLSKGFGNGGLFFTCLAIALLFTRPIVGKLLDRFGFIAVLIPAFLGFTAVMIIFSFAESQLIFLFCAFLLGVSFGAIQTSMQTMAVVNAPFHRRGAANATYFTGFDVGYALGSLAAGSIADYLGYDLMFLLMSVPTIIGLILYITLARNFKINSYAIPD